MKNYSFRILFLLIVSLMLFTACPFSDNNGGLTFLIGSFGNDSGVDAGLYKWSPGSNPQYITEYIPYNLDQRLIDQNSGTIAYRIKPSLTPEGTSGVAYMPSDDPFAINFTPVPQAEEKYYYSIPNACPRVLPNGNIVYRVTHETDNIYDDYAKGMLAIYNPGNGNLELSGDPSGFVLSQPEQGSDTEGGSMDNSFVVDPDGEFVYCTLYGAGTDFGVYHEDYHFIVRYKVGDPGNYERLAQLDGRPTAVSGDGKYLLVNAYEGLMKIDLDSKAMVKMDQYTHDFESGQIASGSNRMFKVWRGSGLGEYTVGSSTEWLHIIDGNEITNSSYRGLRHCGQYSADEEKIYFSGSTDFYTNYASDLIIFETPRIELNETPDSIGFLEAAYCTDMFLLLK
jgi:hypothetical protein